MWSCLEDLHIEVECNWEYPSMAIHKRQCNQLTSWFMQERQNNNINCRLIVNGCPEEYLVKINHFPSWQEAYLLRTVLILHNNCNLTIQSLNKCSHIFRILVISVINELQNILDASCAPSSASWTSLFEHCCYFFSTIIGSIHLLLSLFVEKDILRYIFLSSCIWMKNLTQSL